MNGSCPVCGEPARDVEALAVHLVDEAGRSDGRHVMWLNRNVTKHRTSAAELAELLRDGSAQERVRR